MKRTSLAAAVAVFIGLGVILADSLNIDFELYSLGTPHLQDGSSASGSAGLGCAVYDHAIVANTYGIPSFGTKSLRMSNAVTSGCFGDHMFTKSLTNEAGESTATNGGMSGGSRTRHFRAAWNLASTVPGSEQVGLSVVASPDRGDGARMSWIQMADTPAGLEVNFYDYQTAVGDFVFSNVASALDRTKVHRIGVTMELFEGSANDVVKVFVDGVLMHTGTSWEDYFREWEDGNTRTVDSILFRTGGPAAPNTAGDGFVIDNFGEASGSPTDKDQCKKDGWKSFNNPSFKNQGQCVSYVNTGK